MRIPTVEECYGLMNSYAMLPNIVAHSQQVARVAAAIMDHLKDDTDIHRAAVITACLLHDITKTRSLQTREPHDISGGRLLAELGFPTIGSMVEEHVVLKDFQAEGELLAKELVFYADKRVMHDRIVTVEERVDDLIVRYGTTEERVRLITSNFEQLCRLEEKISRFVTSDIQKIIDQIDSSSSPDIRLPNLTY
ncbi:MAG: HDIG domain-containing protein [Syntrophaceae bacterium]|nr:HDIG domain-containing protein [Syntrophaceae bacterium]